MPKRSRKDVNQLAADILRAATEQPDKNPAAVALGRSGGLKGGRVRAARLSPEVRSDIAKKAAMSRWGTKPPEPAAPTQGGHMTQIDLPVIPHQMEGKLISQRAADGYINATAMCNAAGKQMGHYLENKNTKEFLTELSKDMGLPVEMLVQTIQGGNPSHQGTWVHPQVAINMGQWLSPKFAVQVAKWVYEWLTGAATPEKAKLPVHIQRYMINRSEIPNTHFSMLNEITFALFAPMEVDGYVMPENMVPDISEGKMFSQWLRSQGIDPATFPTYQHRYADGRVVPARLYPNEHLAAFRKHFHEVWLPQRAHEYFEKRDAKALSYLPKLLPKP